MDRNKPPSTSRSSKSKLSMPHHGSELFALGSKQSSSMRDDSKSMVMSSSSKSSDRKREAPKSSSSSTGMSSSTSKKPKLQSQHSTSSLHASSRIFETQASQSLSGTVSMSGGSSSNSSSATVVPNYWEQIAVDCEPADLIKSVLAAIDQQDSDSVLALVCGSIRTLLMSRAKVDPLLIHSLLYLCRMRPNVFSNDTIKSALVTVLKRDTNHAFKGRNNPTPHIIATHLLMHGFDDKKHWPDVLLRVYIDDAINERVWVDLEDCAPFVENLCTAFGTRTPPKSMLQPELGSLVGAASITTGRTSDAMMHDDDSIEIVYNDSSTSHGNSAHSEGLVQPRYTHSTTVQKMVIEAIKEQLNRRQTPESSTRNLLRFLSVTSGLTEVREIAVQRLEQWIHNGKLGKPAQELLTHVCYNITVQTAKDQEILGNLVKMRLKTKPLINIYMTCLKEMVNVNPDLLFLVIKNVVLNELSNARNPNNMGMLACVFQVKPDQSAIHLAEIYQEFILQRDDCLRSLRVFLRELVKVLRFDINLIVFCKNFVQLRPELKLDKESQEHRDRVFFALVDILCLCMFLTISPPIREALQAVRAGRDTKGSSILHNFYRQMSQIQCDALNWMYDMVPGLFKPTFPIFGSALRKILLLESTESYTKGDQWPPEQERALLLRLASETPLQEESIMCVILIGITKEIPFTVPDTVELIEQIVRRASGLRIYGFHPIEVSKLEIIDFLFSMAEYHHPENIVLPFGYEPPKLAITSLYWKAWSILLMLSAHNPTTFGSFCWGQYPILRYLMEMCITNQFTDIRMGDDELQVNALEKTEILEFETHLAAATSKIVITEQNSLLLSQLMLMDPLGVARRPPNSFLEQLQALNAQNKLGHLLCRSRKPDLLLDIIQRQGSSQSMPWLTDLVQNSEGDFSHLPVQCLCEFLLSNSTTINAENTRDAELIQYLQNLLVDPNCDGQTTCEVLEYFMRRLSSTTKQSRESAIKALKLLMNAFAVTASEENPDFEIPPPQESDWLLMHMPKMPQFACIRLVIVAQLRAACQIENDPDLIMVYIQFIAEHTVGDAIAEMLEHIMDMSIFIVERSCVFSRIIPSSVEDTTNKQIRVQPLNCLFIMFNNYMINLKDHKTPYSWSEYPDLLMVSFTDGSKLPIHLNIIQAFIILLTYSPLIPNSQPILEYWFPIGAPPPQAYSLEGTEKILIIPDWLKLKIIKSNVDRLIDAALQDLTPYQIVLFIQNFGTPVNAMSKLFALLDRAVIQQFDEVRAEVLTPGCIAQLMHIQHARGAKNGHIAVQALQMFDQTVTQPKKVVPKVVKRLNIDWNVEKTSRAAPLIGKEIDNVLATVFSNTQVNSVDFRHLAQQLIARDVLGKRMAWSKFESAHAMQQISFTHCLQVLQRIIPRGFKIQSREHEAAIYTLFRSLLSTDAPLSEADLTYLQSIHYEISPTLTLILSNKQKTLNKNNATDGMIGSDLDSVFRFSKITKLERNGRSVIAKFDSTYIVNAIIDILQMDERHDKKPISQEKIGLIVDWLAEADTELVRANPRLQIDLFFHKSHYQFRFLMLSLLSHQVSWVILQKTVNDILSVYREHYDPTSVLHFIEALLKNPKLWQGRDKTVPKHVQVEFILQLSNQDIQVFVDYILAEATNLYVPKIDEDKFEKIIEKMIARILILQPYFERQSFNLKELVEYIRQHTVPEPIKTKMLQSIYLNNPIMKFVCTELKDIYTMNAIQMNGCSTDKISNTIFTTMSALNNSKDFQMLSSDMELLVRKLAATHPVLVLRHMLLLSSLLQGRSHKDLHMLRNENHITLFVQVMGIIELLQPYIFEDAYTEAFHSTLDCYFILMKNYSNAKDVVGIMFRFVDLLQEYSQAKPLKALEFIENYIYILMDMAVVHRKIPSLQQLIHGIGMLKHRVDKSDNNEGDGRSVSAADVILAPYTKATFMPSNWGNLINAVCTRSEDELLQPLQEIENVTLKRQGLLDPLFERLLELIFSPMVGVRNYAHCLLVRHLKRNPGDPKINSIILSSYVKCLTDENTDVVTSALDSLIEIVICLQEYAPELLKLVFDLGIHSKANTFNQIRKCILSLKTQHAS